MVDKNSDQDSNNLGSELLINPRRRKGSNAPSGSSSIASFGRGEKEEEEEERDNAPPLLSPPSYSPHVHKSPTVPHQLDLSATLGNVMGSRRSRSEYHDNDSEDGDDFAATKKKRGGDHDSVSDIRSFRDMKRGDGGLGLARAANREVVQKRFPASSPDNTSVRSWRPRNNRSSRASFFSGKQNDGDDEDECTDSTPSEMSSVASGRSHHYHQRRRPAASAAAVPPRPRPMTEEQIRVAKQGILHEFDRLEQKNYRLSHKFTPDSSLEEMRAEYERIKKDRTVDQSVQFQKNMLMMCVNSIEYLNNRFDPFDFDLEGWSMSISDNLDDYEEIFERLHEKYGGTSKMEPELQLLFSLGGSAMMFNIENKLFKKRVGNGAEDNGKKNNNGGGGGGGLMGMIGSLFSGGGGGGGGNGTKRTGTGTGTNNNTAARRSVSPPPPPSSTVLNSATRRGGHDQSSGSKSTNDPSNFVMRGPVDDDILRDLQKTAFQNHDNERIEMISNGGNDSDMEDIKDTTGMSFFNDNGMDGTPAVPADNNASSVDTRQSTDVAAPLAAPTSTRGGGRSRGGGRGGGGGRKGAASTGKTLAI